MAAENAGSILELQGGVFRTDTGRFRRCPRKLRCAVSTVRAFARHPFSDEVTLIVEESDSGRHVRRRWGDDVFFLEEYVQRDVDTDD